VFSLFDEDSQAFVEEPVNHCLRSAETQTSVSDLLLKRRDGEQFSIRYSASPIMSSADTPLGVILIFHDVTDTRNMERQISWQATHDVLTGLLNRTEFEIQLGYAIKYSAKTGDEHVLCHMDIDQLKIVNETGSHEAGDELIRKVSALLTECLRESDAIARLGGDEFGVLLRNCSIDGATAQVESILKAVNGLRFSSDGRVFGISASIGMTQICSHSKNATHAMSEADLACHAAKELGGNRSHVYQSSDEELMRRQNEMQWVSKIAEAIQTDRLTLYCQTIAPSVPPDDDSVHFEVLVRMLDERSEIIMPDKFLPAAERYNLITGLDRWVISHSFAWYAEHCPMTDMQCLNTMAINLSGVSINDTGFQRYIKNEMEKYGIPPAAICFEITETAAITNLSAASEFICDLRKLGCRFALDDFGSGLSSFGYLKNLPVDYLKIDGTFVRDMDTDAVNFAMVSAIQQLGSVIGIQTIAEFVENERIIEILTEMGVDYLQGYAISRPMPLDELDVSARRSA
jgi:diguanylate cyclase (GGDEF)-like protein